MDVEARPSATSSRTDLSLHSCWVRGARHCAHRGAHRRARRGARRGRCGAHPVDPSRASAPGAAHGVNAHHGARARASAPGVARHAPRHAARQTARHAQAVDAHHGVNAHHGARAPMRGGACAAAPVLTNPSDARTRDAQHGARRENARRGGNAHHGARARTSDDDAAGAFRAVPSGDAAGGCPRDLAHGDRPR